MLACPTNSEPVNQREKLDKRYVGPHAIESHASQRILRGFSRVSLIDIGQLLLVSGDLLYLLCKLLDLCAILLAGRSYMQRQQVSQRVHPACTFTPLRRLAPSYPARAPDSGVDWIVRLSVGRADFHERPREDTAAGNRASKRTRLRPGAPLPTLRYAKNGAPAEFLYPVSQKRDMGHNLLTIYRHPHLSVRRSLGLRIYPTPSSIRGQSRRRGAPDRLEARHDNHEIAPVALHWLRRGHQRRGNVRRVPLPAMWRVI